MSVIQIRKAQREGARLVIGFAGVSGSGKTYTAIQVAHGLANGDSSKIGFLDTENRRGSLYADILPEPFFIGDLYAPFSPARYAEAIREFQAAGVEVLVIDSVSHEWEGIGGAQEIAEAGNPRLPNWNRAKAEHKRFMNALLACDMHVIVCIRAREKAKPEKQYVDGKEKTVYVDLGLQPIAEKNFVFELTAGLMLHEAGKRQELLKVPADLMPILGRGSGYLTAADGRSIRAWVDGAKQLDPAIERARNAVILASQEGVEALKAAWSALSGAQQKALGKAFLEERKAAAAEFDLLNAVPVTVAAGALADDLAASAADVPGAVRPLQDPTPTAAAAMMPAPAPTKPAPTKPAPATETVTATTAATPTKPAPARAPAPTPKPATHPADDDLF